MSSTEALASAIAGVMRWPINLALALAEAVYLNLISKGLWKLGITEF